MTALTGVSEELCFASKRLIASHCFFKKLYRLKCLGIMTLQGFLANYFKITDPENEAKQN